MAVLAHPFFRRDGLSTAQSSASNWLIDTGAGGDTKLLPSNFVVGRQYLLICCAGIKNTDNGVLAGARMVRIDSGSNVTATFGNSSTRFEISGSQTAGVSWPYFWFRRWTATTDRGVALQIFTDGATGRTYHAFLMALDVTDLQTHQSRNTTSVALSSTPSTSGASVTFTPTPNSRWLYLYLDRLQPLQNNQSVITRRFATPLSTFEYGRSEGEQAPNDRILHAWMEVRTEGASPSTVTVRPESWATVATGGGNRLGSQVFAMNIDQFDFAKTHRLTTAIQGTINYDLDFVNTNWQAGDPNPNTDALVLGCFGFDPDNNGSHLQFSTRNAQLGTPYRTGTEVDQEDWYVSHDATDRFAAFEAFNSVIDGTARTWWVRGNGTNPNNFIRDRNLLVFSTSTPAQTPVSKTTESYVSTTSPTSKQTETYVSAQAPVSASQETYCSVVSGLAKTAQVFVAVLGGIAVTTQSYVSATGFSDVSETQESYASAFGALEATTESYVSTTSPVSQTEETYSSSQEGVESSEESYASAQGGIEQTEQSYASWTSTGAIAWFQTHNFVNTLTAATALTEISGIAYDEANDEVLAVDDSDLYRRINAIDGSDVGSQGTFNGTNQIDTEGITHIANDRFAVLSEGLLGTRNAWIHIADIPVGDTDITQSDIIEEHELTSVTLFGSGFGAEGLAYDPASGKYYVAVQDTSENGGGLWEVDPGNSWAQTLLFRWWDTIINTSEVPASTQVGDLAWGGNFAGAPCVFVLCKETTPADVNSRVVIQMDLAGNVIDKFNHGLTDQAEGLDFSSSGRTMFVAKEHSTADDFFRFDDQEIVFDWAEDWDYDDSDTDRFSGTPFHDPTYDKSPFKGPSAAPFGDTTDPVKEDGIEGWDPSHPTQAFGTIVLGLQAQISYYYIKDVTINNVSQITQLTVDVICDDGCALFLNGTEILDLRFTSTPAHDAVSTGVASGNDEGAANTFTFTDAPTLALLTEGTNRFAVYHCNASTGSSDLVFDARASILRDDSETPISQTTESYVSTTAPLSQSEETYASTTSPLEQTEETYSSSVGAVEATTESYVSTTSPLEQSEETYSSSFSPVSQSQSTYVSSLAAPISATEETYSSIFSAVARAQTTRVSAEGALTQSEESYVSTTSPIEQSEETYSSADSGLSQTEESYTSALGALSQSEESYVSTTAPLEQTEESYASAFEGLESTQQSDWSSLGGVDSSEETYSSSLGQDAVSQSEESYTSALGALEQTEESYASALAGVESTEQSDWSSLGGIDSSEETYSSATDQAAVSATEESYVSTFAPVESTTQTYSSATAVGTVIANQESYTSALGALSQSEESYSSTTAPLEQTEESYASALEGLESTEQSDWSSLGGIDSSEETYSSSLGSQLVSSSEESYTSALGALSQSDESYVSTTSPVSQTEETYASALEGTEAETTHYASSLGSLSQSAESYASTTSPLFAAEESYASAFEPLERSGGSDASWLQGVSASQDTYSSATADALVSQSEESYCSAFAAVSSAAQVYWSADGTNLFVPVRKRARIGPQRRKSRI